PHVAICSAKACLQCRKVKMKCRPVMGSTTCERCTRKSTDCVFFQKKRGRKPMRYTGHHCPHPHGQRTPSTEQDSSRNVHDPDEAGSDFWAESEGLQPSSLLNKQAMKGKFSLQNLLTISHGLHLIKESGTTLSADDPINKKILSYHIATSLFEGHNLNPFICVLDPSLHTFQYVRERSSFLLTVLLAAAAKAFNPALHSDLRKYSEKLLVDSFARGTKSPEVIQAILLNTYWKEPDDTRSWSFIGYAIRLCMELGWHKLAQDREEDDVGATPEFQVRQRRNLERTWLVLFVYDRSMSLQTGKPWMIERSEFIESANTWYRHSLAISNDATLSALVTLRLAAADILEVFNPQRPAPSVTHAYRFDSLLKTLTPQIEAWKQHWVRVTSDRERCHFFLVSFFGMHVLLVLYSFPLQASISSPIGASLVDTEAFWITYTSALEMLSLVSHPSLTPFLSFAHDSIHAMTAYAAAFLIKLLLSVNGNIRREFERTALDAIQNAAHVFAQQSTPPTFGCALQANFLSNVIREYERACKRRFVAVMNDSNPGSRSDSANTQRASRNVPRQHRRVRENTEQPQPQSDPGAVQGALQTERRETPDELQTLISNGDCIVASEMPDVGDISRAEGESSIHPGFTDASPPDWSFADNEKWTAMFMTAGFDIGGGTFMPIE
ncbi:hypothetical protein GQ53DRAFT_638910, partial [Thozetella sp. PMI_491]